ncbi:twin-arginine translocase subunit TatC [uncultured Senegalimassilia sp.]|uniref:twin-arginine translocase subunit TatC n=1 Tax=uncultured Senegalimassilia sp. TaxID=1714350 RepID=UPI0025FE92A6|nr:twin-arginine translocase subunit TatC [uncultured Senegalimassilia sp.]
MPIGPARMPLFDHLGELRMRLVRIVVCLLVGVCVFYFATPTMGQFLMIPIAEYLPKGPDGLPSFMAIDPFEAFSTRFKISIWAAIVACSPVILWQLLAFFLPALKPNERKWFVPTFAAAVALFIVGTVFCYCIILNPAFQWLTDQAMGLGTVTPRMASYVDIIIKFELGFGVAFELPLVIFYLVVFNVVPYKKLRDSWRGIYVGLLVFCAIVTPDASPVTMALMFAALIVLYEVSLLLARIALGRRIKKQNEELAKEEGAAQAAAPKAKKLKAVKRK